MELNFYDYHDFKKNQGGYRIMRHTVQNYSQLSKKRAGWAEIFIHNMNDEIVQARAKTQR